MRLLLDTCSLIWLVQQPERLGAKCQRALADPWNDLFVSAVSLWEMSIKSSLGRLDLENATVESFIAMAEAHGCQWIGLQPDVAASFYRLPIVGDHRDPFDRILVWQAIRSNFALTSRDRVIAAYEPHGLIIIW